MCGPDARPAEDVPEDEDDGLPTAGTAAMDLDRAHLPQTNAPAASSWEEPRAAAVPVNSDVCHGVFDAPIKAATAETAPAAEEAQPPATDEAPTKQPPKKRVSFSIEEPQFHSVPSR